jgi:hypothetical protein
VQQLAKLICIRAREGNQHRTRELVGNGFATLEVTQTGTGKKPAIRAPILGILFPHRIAGSFQIP